MALEVIRVKRKAHEEPAENLVLSVLKKKKLDLKVHLKLACTLDETASNDKQQIHGAIKKAKLKNFRICPKSMPANKHNRRMEILKEEQKEKRWQMLEKKRRLIFTQFASFDGNVKKSIKEDDECTSDFLLYDIIEECTCHLPDICPLPHSDVVEKKSIITCNGQPMSPVTKASDKCVYDMYYITNGKIDDHFIHNTLSIEPIESEFNQLLYDEDEEEEYLESEDDSNDENNWRNDYPDEQDEFDAPDHLLEDYVFSSDDDYSFGNAFKDMSIGSSSVNAYPAFKKKMEGATNDFEDKEYDSDF